MIPVDISVLAPIDIRINKSDSKKQISDKKRLTKELDWCQKNEDLIVRKANKLYDLRTNYPQENIALTKRCCDFKKLETVLGKRLAKEQPIVAASAPVKKTLFSRAKLKAAAQSIEQQSGSDHGKSKVHKKDNPSL